MSNVTQPSERPATFPVKLQAMMDGFKEDMGRKWSEEKAAEYEVVATQSLITEAKDKIEYSLKGAIRRGKHKKLQMSESEFSELWRTKMEKRLFGELPKGDGYPEKLTKKQQEILDAVTERTKQKKAEESSKLAVETLKKVIMES